MEQKTMNYYALELEKIRKICFSNKLQIAMSIDTKRYIDQNFDTAINLELLARLRHTSKYHLIRIFKRYYGITPAQYLINKRISEAKKLLEQGNTVSETCYLIGFESLNSFSNLFKRKTGKSPSEYKRAFLNKSKD